MMKTAAVIFMTLLLALLATSSDGFQQSRQPYRPTGNEGTITGKISFSGEAPRPRDIDMQADPECVKAHPEPLTEEAVITEGMVVDVLVYVKSDALDRYQFEPPATPVTLERKGCQLTPRVFGIQTDPTLLALNPSPVRHNTNVQPTVNPRMNKFQEPGGGPLEFTFAQPDRLVVIKDNQHPWEKAYLAVFSHPFFTVTGTDGGYTLEGLPAGQYTVIAWHEHFGEQEMKVRVAAREMHTVDFDFKTAER